MKVTVFVWNWISKFDNSRRLEKAAEYVDNSNSDPEWIAQHAFHIFNAPEGYLTEEEIQILGDYHKKFPSLSVGDFVKVESENEIKMFRCESFGWKEVDEIKENEVMSAEDYRKRI